MIMHREEVEMSKTCKNCLAIGLSLLLFGMLTFTAYFSYHMGVKDAQKVENRT